MAVTARHRAQVAVRVLVEIARTRADNKAKAAVAVRVSAIVRAKADRAAPRLLDAPKVRSVRAAGVVPPRL